MTFIIYKEFDANTKVRTVTSNLNISDHIYDSDLDHTGFWLDTVADQPAVSIVKEDPNEEAAQKKPLHRASASEKSLQLNFRGAESLTYLVRSSCWQTCSARAQEQPELRGAAVTWLPRLWQVTPCRGF